MGHLECRIVGRKLIGQILIEKGYVTLIQVYEVRKNQLLTESGESPPPLFGEILLQLGYVTPAQVEEAIRLQEGCS